MDDYSPRSSASVPQMRFGKIDDLISRVGSRHRRCPQVSIFPTARGRLLVRRTRSRHHARVRLHPASLRCSAQVTQRRFDESSAPHTESSERRRRLEHLRWRTVEHFGIGQGLLWAEAGGFQRPTIRRWRSARKKILDMGGVTEVNTFTKIYLCFFGQYDYDAVPAIPPEIVLFPNWFWFNIYEISSWSRAILVPLSICYAKKPFKKIPRRDGRRGTVRRRT